MCRPGQVLGKVLAELGDVGAMVSFAMDEFPCLIKALITMRDCTRRSQIKVQVESECYLCVYLI